jgi:3-oxoacyl-[acyl-carrier protein] reductase
MNGPIAVTGAARGIGNAIAARLVNDGRTVVLADIDPSVSDAAGRLGGSAVAVEADLTTGQGRRALLSALPAAPQGLVNNAGITRDSFVTKMSEEDFRAVIEVNLAAAYELTRLLAPRFIKGSSVVSMSSRAYLGNMGQYNYSMSKGALVGMTRALAQEMAPDIRFNAVAPGLIATDMTMAMPQKVRDRLISMIPLQRMGEPQEVAALVSFLLSGESSYVTGQVHIPCGGRSISA